jgi:Protein of unknown function (DUF3667)
MSTPAPAETDTVAQAAGVASGAHSPTGTITCANCGARLTGKYCSECGQRHHDHPVHDFWHFTSEALEDLTHADSRLWQTLTALLFRPGLLTREFLEGRRVRYLPPVRLYLVVSLIFFIIVGLSSRIPKSYVVLSYGDNSFHYQVVPTGKVPGPGAVGGTSTPAASGSAAGPATLTSTPAARERLCEEFGASVAQHAGWFGRFAPRVTRSCLTALAAGGLEHFDEVVERNLERAMFLFLPLLALAMKPLYLQPPRHYIEHLLFFLHSHAFLFVVLGVGTLAGMSTSSPLVLEPVNTAIAIYVPIYFYLALRRVYGQGRWLTLSKLAGLAVVYCFLAIVLVAATASYSFLML